MHYVNSKYEMYMVARSNYINWESCAYALYTSDYSQMDAYQVIWMRFSSHVDANQ